MTYEITIGIPIYNKEKYIVECVVLCSVCIY